jgi:hypothetical protein
MCCMGRWELFRVLLRVQGKRPISRPR